jgi:hypothetical protein
MSEPQKRKAFAKAYGNPQAQERLVALDLLTGGQEHATMIVLSRVASIDPDKDVRAKAFAILADWADPEGKLCTVLLPLFQQEKDQDAKLAKAKHLPKLAIKSPSIDAVISHLTNYTYVGNRDPDRDRDWRNNNNNNNNNDRNTARLAGFSKEDVAKTRKYYSELVGVLNQLSGQSFSANRRTNREVRSWWQKNAAQYRKADQETVKKLRAELAAKKK